MKVVIDNEVKDMSFWSFFKGYFLSWLLLTGLTYVFFFIVGITLA